MMHTWHVLYTCLEHFSYLTHQQQFWQLKHQIRIFSGDISILASFVGKFKINLPVKERVPWERGCTIYTHPLDHLHFQDGWRAVYNVSLVIVGGERIDNLPPKPWTNWRKKYLHDAHGSHDSHRGLHGSLARRFCRPSHVDMEWLSLSFCWQK